MEQDQGESKNTGLDETRQVPFWRVVLSVVQASFGVQNASNRERDFNSRSIWPYVIAALLFTGVFVLTLVLVVSLVLPD